MHHKLLVLIKWQSSYLRAVTFYRCPFIMSLNTADLSHMNSACAGTSCDSCSANGHDKRNIKYNCSYANWDHVFHKMYTAKRNCLCGLQIAEFFYIVIYDDCFHKPTVLIFVMCYRLMEVESFCFLRNIRLTWFIPHIMAAYYLLCCWTFENYLRRHQLLVLISYQVFLHTLAV
jgi:hypothetical protein